jgi:hypothetical protein
MLDELGQAQVLWIGGRKQYQITEVGEQYLSFNKTARDAALAQMGVARLTIAESTHLVALTPRNV